jgi:adenylate cyclase
MPQIAPAAALHRNSFEGIFDWFLSETHEERFIDRVFAQLGDRLLAAGMPLARASLHLRTQHREWLGAALFWHPGLEAAEITMTAYGVDQTERYLNSPVRDIHQGSPEVRRKIWALVPEDYDYPILAELAEDGITDYVAWPLLHTLGRRHVVTFGSDAPLGFSDYEIAFLRRLVPLIALATEVRLKNVVTRVLLETYVGPIAAQRILAGETRRGLGSSIEAATMISDLRHFTDLTAERPRDEVIAVLNAYFEAIADPIERHGGEILKFMGDGMLAIFPLDQPDASGNLIAAVREGQERLAALNAENLTSGLPELHQGVGIHLGEVSYGNIGSRNRLDFTVIGPVVNIAARLQGLTREVDCPVLVTGDFARRANRPEDFHAIGTFPVRGIPDPIEVLALKL